MAVYNLWGQVISESLWEEVISGTTSILRAARIPEQKVTLLLEYTGSYDVMWRFISITDNLSVSMRCFSITEITSETMAKEVFKYWSDNWVMNDPIKLQNFFANENSFGIKYPSKSTENPIKNLDILNKIGAIGNPEDFIDKNGFTKDVSPPINKKHLKGIQSKKPLIIKNKSFYDKYTETEFSPCPLCNGTMAPKAGKFGIFYSCTNWALTKCPAIIGRKKIPNQKTQELIDKKNKELKDKLESQNENKELSQELDGIDLIDI